MVAVFNLKITRPKCPPPIKDQNKAEFKGDMVLPYSDNI